MTTPISSKVPQPRIIIDEDCQEIKDIMKETMGETLSKTSEKAKIVLKRQADNAIEKFVIPATIFSKAAITQTSPREFSSIIHESIDQSVQPTAQKLMHHSIDKSVDSSAEKIMYRSTDTFVHSITSMINGIYTYIRGRFT